MNIDVIWVDDDERLMDTTEPIFNDYGFNLIKCVTISEGLKHVLRGRSSNLLLDIDFPNNPKEGMVFLEQVKLINPDLRVVLFTGFPEVNDAVVAVRELMAADYIPKPIPLNEHKRALFFDKIRRSFNDEPGNSSTSLLRNGNFPDIIKLRKALETYDVDTFILVLKSLFAGLSYNMKVQESYFHSFIQLLLSAAGVKVNSEEETNKGRIDIVAETAKYIYLMEFKLSDASIAIAQIRAQKYFQKYLTNSKQVVLVGIAFDSKEKNIKNYVVERLGIKPSDTKN
jgi:ActR/RegA family two-component response regulator